MPAERLSRKHRGELERIVREDLASGAILQMDVYVAPDGEIGVNEIVLRLHGGREVAIAPRDGTMQVWIEAPPGVTKEITADNYGVDDA